MITKYPAYRCPECGKEFEFGEMQGDFVIAHNEQHMAESFRQQLVNRFGEEAVKELDREAIKIHELLQKRFHDAAKQYADQVPALVGTESEPPSDKVN